MIEKIMPLPVKKNKLGIATKNLTATEYYGQIVEEMLEAYEQASLAQFDDDERREPEELIDIITCCVTRLEIIGYDEDKRQKIYADVKVSDMRKKLTVDEHYRLISKKVLEAHKEAVVDELSEITDAYCDIYDEGQYEAEALVKVIACCILRLENIGCDEEKRQQIYSAVNEKNRRRGYFEEV